MAGENNNSDILILDNKKYDRNGYINLLKSRGLKLDIISDLKDREKIYTTSAKVFIIAYAEGQKDGSGAFKTIKESDTIEKITNEQWANSIITGIDIAKDLRLAEKERKYYIHMVSSEAKKKIPVSSEFSWDNWIKKGTIDSYSTRDPDDFVDYVKKIIKAVEERK